MHAFGQGDASRPHELELYKYAHACARALPSSVRVASLLSQVLIKVLEHTESFDHDQLCTILRCLTQLDLPLHDSFLEKVGHRLGQLLAGMDDAARGKCLEGCLVPYDDGE